MNLSELIALLQELERKGKGDWQVAFWKYNKSIEREQVRALEEYNLCEHKNTKSIVING